MAPYREQRDELLCGFWCKLALHLPHACLAFNLDLHADLFLLRQLTPNRSALPYLARSERINVFYALRRRSTGRGSNRR